MAKNYNDFKMFNQIILTETGYSEGKKLHTIDCNNKDKSHIDCEYIDKLTKLDFGYELIGREGQQIKPCFDCDPKFNIDEDVDVLKTINEGIREVDKMYPNTEKYVIMRIRKLPDENKKKISFHITVDGIRTNCQTILNRITSLGYKKDEPFDHSIYTPNRGLYPIFSNKKKPVPLHIEAFKAIDINTGKILKWPDIDLKKYCPSYVEENFKPDFMQPPLGPSGPKEPKEKREIQYDDDNKDNSNLKLEEIITHLKPHRANDREDWLNGIFCVINCAENLGFGKKKQKDIAHLFSSICEEKYEEDLVDDWLDKNFDKKRENGYRWKFLLDWLKEDDIEYYNANIVVTKNKILPFKDTKKEFEKRYKKIMFPPVIFDVKRGDFYGMEKCQKSFSHLKFTDKNCKGEDTLYGFFTKWCTDVNVEVYEEMKWLPNKQPSQNGDDILNTWTGWEIEQATFDDWDSFNQENDYWKWFQQFSKNLWGSEEISNYILARYALRIQNPEKRSFICCIYYGPQGVGKSSFLDIIQSIFGKYFVTLDCADKIFEPHSMYEVNKLLLCVNETKGGANHKNSNILKTRITEPELQVNPKGIQMYKEFNYCDYDMPTNNINVVDYSDESKRRFFQVEATSYYCPVKKPEMTEYWTNFKNNIEKDPRVHKQIFEGLKKFDIKKVVPSGNFQDEKCKPVTSVASDVKYLNRCKILHFLYDLVNYVEEWLECTLLVDKDLMILLDEKNSGGEIITKNDKLFECFDLWCKKSKINFDMNKIVFGRKMKKYADDIPNGAITKDTNNKTRIHREGFLEYWRTL